MRPEDVVPEDLDDRNLGGHELRGVLHPHLPLFDHDWTSRDMRPATVIAALQQQAPGDAYVESYAETAVTDDAIAYALVCMTAEDLWVLNAIQFERITYDELSVRLGVSRTQGWRLHQRAITRLRTLLLNHPPIREKLGMTETWNAAAMHELVEMLGYEEGWEGPEYNLATFTDYVSVNIAAGNIVLNDGRELDAVTFLAAAASWACGYLRSIGRWSLLDMHTLLCSKQNDYGHGNITRFGMVGVMVRASDKAERLKNLTLREGVNPANESVVDSFVDVVGYAVIARMLKAETFELELEVPESGDAA